MLFCRDGDGPIYVKVGFSERPGARIGGLLTGCPIPAIRFASTELRDRRGARRAEKAMHAALAKWRGEGEWFCLLESDKEEFNKAWKAALAPFHEPAWPMRWSQLPLRPYLAAKQARQKYVYNRVIADVLKRRGRAYSDYLLDSRVV